MRTKSFSDAISDDSIFIWGHEYLSQPDPDLINRIPTIKNRNEISLAMANEKDIVLLSQEITPGYLSWLRDVGLSTDNVFVINSDSRTPLPELIIGNHGLKSELSNFNSNKFYIPRFSGELDSKASKFLNSSYLGADSKLARILHDKSQFKELMKDNGLPVPSGELVKFDEISSAEAKSKLEFYLVETGSIILKPTSQASGSGFVELNSENINCFDLSSISGDMLLETKYDLEREFSVQNIVGLDSIVDQSYTSQLVSGFTHIGNYFLKKEDVPSQIIDINNISSELISSLGYLGPYGLDILKTKDGQYLICEANARFTGPMPSANILANVNSSLKSDYEAAFFLFDSPKLNFNDFVKENDDLLYDPLSRKGLVPMKVCELSNGFFEGPIIGETKNEINSILTKLYSRGISVKGKKYFL